MTDQTGLFLPPDKDADPMAPPVIAPPEHPYQMPVDTYEGSYGRTASMGLEELQAVGYTIEHSWELKINETYGINLPDGLVTTAANVRTPDRDLLMVVWDPRPGNFFCDDEIIRPGEKEIKLCVLIKE